MKYSVEYKNGKYIETLEINGATATKTQQYEEGGDISGLCSKDLDFSEQLEWTFDESFCDDVYNTFDNNMWLADISDFVEISELAEIEEQEGEQE